MTKAFQATADNSGKLPVLKPAKTTKRRADAARLTFEKTFFIASLNFDKV